MEEEEKLNFEKIREIHREEKEKATLTKIFDDFYEKVRKYILEKKESIKNIKNKEGRFVEDLLNDLEWELKNAKKIIQDIYDRRERKIVLQAILMARSDSKLIDTSKMLDFEKKFFDELVNLIRSYRENILKRVLNGEEPEVIKEEKEDKIETNKLENYSLVRFLDNIPEFVWTDEKVYGPFNKEDIATIPKDLAEFLNQKGKIVKLE